MLAVYKKLLEMSVNTPKDDLKNMLRAAIFLVRRAIKDIVSSVSCNRLDKKCSSEKLAAKLVELCG